VQRYQVFIDEHSISIAENRKSNQQLETIFEVFEPKEAELIQVVEWLSKEKEAVQHVFLNSKNPSELWDLFTAQFKYIEAAGGVVLNESYEMLLIYRLDKWDLPKGKLEKGEKPKEAAVREVEEECGISNLLVKRELDSTFHIYYHKEKWVLKKTFWYEMSYSGKQDLIPQTEEAIEKAVWVKPNDLSDKLENTYASLKTLIASFLA